MIKILYFIFISTLVFADTPPIIYQFAAPLVKTGGKNISIPKADATHNGYLSSADFNTFSSGGVTNVTASSPLFSSGGATPNITCQTATGLLSGCLSSIDWAAFNSKEPAISSGSSAQYFRGDKTFQTLNTLVVPENTNLYYTAARFNVAFSGKSTTDLSEGTNLYYTNGRVDTEFDTRLATKNTSSLAEGTNLYFTNGRAQSAISATSPLTYSSGAVGCQTSSGSQAGCLSSTDWSTFNSKQSAGSYVSTTRNINTSAPLIGGGNLAADLTLSIPVATTSINGYLSSVDWTTFNLKEPAITSGTTSQYFRGDKTFQTLNTLAVPELTNLYYTQSRFDTAFSAKTTTDLTEGTNLYFTNAKVDSRVKAGTGTQELWVSKETGNDANDGSIVKPYLTIGAAITAANSIAAYYKQVIIHVAPVTNGGSAGGSYNENISFTQQGVNLICDHAGAYSRPCVVTGTLTVNLTGVSGGTNFNAGSNEVTISGFVFTSSSSNTVTFSGTVFQRLIAMNCYFQASAARAAVVTNTGVSGAIPSQFRSYDTTFENNSSTIEVVTLTAGRFWLYGTTGTIQNNNSSGPSVIQNGLSSMIANIVQFTGQYQLTDNTATATFNLSTIASGTASCISTPASPSTGYALLAYFGCNSSNTNSLTGSGVVVNAPGNARFGTSGDIVSTITQASLGPGLPQGELMLGPNATTGTNVLLSIFGGHIKVSQTTAPTATPHANAGTSAICTLTNGRDSSGIINLTEGSALWASGTQCTVTFNKAYGVAPNCILWPHNAAASLHLVTQQIFSTTTTTTLLLSFGVADLGATASQWSYKCEEP